MHSKKLLLVHGLADAAHAASAAGMTAARDVAGHALVVTVAIGFL